MVRTLVAAAMLAGVATAQGPVHAVLAAGPASGSMSRGEAYRMAAALSAVGARMFADPALSESGRLACASCHVPERAFGPPDDRLAVRLGGGDERRPGLRAVPSLRYLQAAPAFTEHYFDSEDEADESVDNGPTGGLTWDGRVDRGGEQARIPLLSPFEMGNTDAAEVAGKAERAGYADRLRGILGGDAVRGPEDVFRAVLKALEVYEQDGGAFYPYSSKYDAYLAGRARLTAAERRGLELFEDPDKGNCASCHRSGPGNDGTPPQFTDFGLIALGVPRNPAVPANADPAHHDLGVCGPLRVDLRDRPEYCGLFRTPSLRNVATRRVFFHNGLARTLRQAVAFYVERDTRPERWYPRGADGAVRKYDDLPAAYRDNVNTDPPFGGRPGDRPALGPREIDDVVAFLHTLTDGYRPGD